MKQKPAVQKTLYSGFYAFDEKTVEKISI